MVAGQHTTRHHWPIFVFTGAVKENLHAVVSFEDPIGVVPWDHVTMVDSTEGDSKKCNVLWSDELSYDAIIIFKGTIT